MFEESQFEKVVSLDTGSLKKWISQNQDLPKFDWIALAEYASLQTRIKKNYDWASIAISIYEKLSEDREDATFILAAMNLREFLIRQLESKRFDPILDPKVITNWFTQSVKRSPSEVETLAADWSALDSDTQIQLRTLKDRLSIVLRLYTNPNATDLPEAFNHWARVYDKIP